MTGRSLSSLAIIIGALLAAYSAFIYDPTVSTYDGRSCDYVGDERERNVCYANNLISLLDVQNGKIPDIRVVNTYRLEVQNRIFYSGLILVIIGIFGIWTNRKNVKN